LVFHISFFFIHFYQFFLWDTFFGKTFKLIKMNSFFQFLNGRKLTPKN